jgi:hypothetical protein
MDRDEILAYLDALKQKDDIRIYTPFKYFKGLKTRTDVRRRFREIVDSKRSSEYRRSVFRTDDNKKTRPSRYTQLFAERYPDAVGASLAVKARITGVPVDILQRVYEKGRAAWKTGHRVGATPEQWGHARVHSFCVVGCTAFASDFPLLEEAIHRMRKTDPRTLKFLRQPVSCPESSIRRFKDKYQRFRTLSSSL